MSTPRTKLAAPQRIREVDARLEHRFGGTASSLCALRRRSAFELLVATVLSAQCTDVRVNEVTPALFDRFPTPEAMAAAPLDELESIIRPTGFFRSKARHLKGLSLALVERFDGAVPHDLDALASLPGVGRKTGNVVRSVGFGEPGLPVDTHVIRLSRRLGLTRHKDPVAIERALCASLPPERWGGFSSRMILHGRATCVARRPACDACVLEDLCPRLGVVSVSAPRRQPADATQRRREPTLDRD